MALASPTVLVGASPFYVSSAVCDVCVVVRCICVGVPRMRARINADIAECLKSLRLPTKDIGALLFDVGADVVDRFFTDEVCSLPDGGSSSSCSKRWVEDFGTFALASSKCR